jgi:FixJ family two-component response regulator
MSESVSQIYVLADDVSVREAVGSLIRSAGLGVKTFSSAQETLASLREELPSCLVLDIQVPDINGFELQQELAAKDIQIPTIFLTGDDDIPMSIRAIKAGVLEFLTKPFEDEYLMEAIRGRTSFSQGGSPESAERKSVRPNFRTEIRSSPFNA